MKKLLAKIGNKRLKGNISLLVILILLASSVISLLSINQILHLMTYGNMTFNYFRAFYLAKAWTELWLTEVYNRGDGFSHKVLSGSTIVSWNLLSGYEWFEPHFEMTITGSFATLTNDIRNPDCSWNKIRLTSWAWIMLSLFDDRLSHTSNIKEILSDYSWVSELNDNFIKNIWFKDIHWEWWTVNYFTFWLFDYSDAWDMDNIVVESGNNLQQFLTDHISSTNWSRRYLTIKNPGTWDEVAEFCITMENKLIPYSNFLITVFWHYGDMEVWIQSVVKKWVPDWTLNVLDNVNSSS